jgi:hypothetical protein
MITLGNNNPFGWVQVISKVESSLTRGKKKIVGQDPSLCPIEEFENNFYNIQDLKHIIIKSINRLHSSFDLFQVLLPRLVEKVFLFVVKEFYYGRKS